MTPGSDKLDRILDGAGAPDPVPPALQERIAAAILPGLRPVRPIPSAGAMVLGLELLVGAVGIAAAFLFGMYGIAKMSGAQSAAILAAIAFFGAVAANQTVASMIPGTRQIVRPGALIFQICLVLIGIFALSFTGYATDDFVRQGVPCLRAGLLVAVPAGAGAWLILHRGYAVDPVSAGLAAGTLAGMAGVLMLELHCPILRAVHVMVWHVAVVPLSALAGALLAKCFTSRG